MLERDNAPMAVNRYHPPLNTTDQDIFALLAWLYGRNQVNVQGLAQELRVSGLYPRYPECARFATSTTACTWTLLDSASRGNLQNVPRLSEDRRPLAEFYP